MGSSLTLNFKNSVAVLVLRLGDLQLWNFQVTNPKSCCIRKQWGSSSAANLDLFLGGSTRFWAQFSGSNGSGWPSGSQNGCNQVGLISKRVQIRVQPYNVLNKPKRVGFGHQGPKSGWVGSGWPSGSKNGSNRVGLASERIRIQPYNVLDKPNLNPTHFWVWLGPQGSIWVELGLVGPQGQNSSQIWVGLVGFIWPHYHATSTLFSQSAYLVCVLALPARTTEPQPCQRRDQMAGPIV